MAIQLDLANTQYGTPFLGAYFRIQGVMVSRARAREGYKFAAMLDVAGFVTRPPNNDTRPVDFRRYQADLTDVEAMAGATFLDKCYAWVMTQEDMNGSIAV